MVVAHSLSGMWDFPGSRTESMSPALVGEFFTTEPLGSPIIFLNILSGFFFFFFFETLLTFMLVCWIFSCRSLRLFFFNLFSLCYSDWKTSAKLSSN